jgi:hypothetical protein
MSRAACDEVEALNVTDIDKSRDWEAPASQMGLLPSLCHGYGRWRGRGSGKAFLILVAHWPLKQRPLYKVHEVGPSFHDQGCNVFLHQHNSYLLGGVVSSVLPAGCWIDQIKG